MQATLALREKMAILLAADTATLASVLGNKVHPVKADFAPSESMTITDFTMADFDGSTALEVTPGPQLEGLDPATNDAIIDLNTPVGGFRWETTGLTNLPQTIFGYVLTNSLGTVVLGATRLTNPIVLSGLNQRIDAGDLTFRQLANSLL